MNSGPANLTRIVEAPAAESPDAVAVEIHEYGKAPERIRWLDLWREASARAALLASLGLRKGDPVLLAVPTSRAFLTNFFGVLIAGGVTVPVPAPSTLKGPGFAAQASHLKRIAGDCSAAGLIAFPPALDALRQSFGGSSSHLRFIPADEIAPSADYGAIDIAPHAPALLQYTSGSTGHPKGVELTHGALLANVRAIAGVVAGDGSRGVSWLPLYHDMGLIGSLLTALYARTPLALMAPQNFIKDPAAWLRTVSDFRATITVAPNFAFDYCVTEISPADLKGVRLDSLEFVLNGAEPVHLSTVERFEATFRPYGLRRGAIRPVYGLAENSLAVTFSGPDLRSDTVDADLLEAHGLAATARPGGRARKLVSVGRPLAGQEVRIVDENGRPLPERAVGEITVHSPSVMKGYFGRVEESAAALRGGWLHTGDLGYIADGQLFISGRRKDLIIRHGRKYHPEDLEAEAATVEGIFRDGVAAFGIEDNDSTTVVLVAELSALHTAPLDSVRRAIRDRLQQQFLFGPDDIRLVRRGAVPRTTSGKVRRQDSKRLYLSGEFRRFELPSAAPRMAVSQTFGGDASEPA